MTAILRPRGPVGAAPSRPIAAFMEAGLAL